eukprot:676820-Amphidinium_carterae.2
MCYNNKINYRRVLLLPGVTIATNSKTQQTIAQSSAEAKLYAMGTTVNDVINVRNFLHELEFKLIHTTRLHRQLISKTKVSH